MFLSWLSVKYYCICCVHAGLGLRRRGGNGERRSRAHGVARSHVAYYTKFRGSFSFSRKERKGGRPSVGRYSEITERTKSNCRGGHTTCPRAKTSLYSKTYTEGSDPFVPFYFLHYISFELTPARQTFSVPASPTHRNSRPAPRYRPSASPALRTGNGKPMR